MTQQEVTQGKSHASRKQKNNSEQARLTNICFPLK
jgi:hypothetical protein